MARPKKAKVALQENKTLRHFNDVLDQDKADKVMEGIILNKSLAEIANETGVTQTTAFKWIRGVKVDIDYPETREEWQNAVTDYLGIAIYKATKRMAEGDIDMISPDKTPLAMAIMLDKKLLMEGTPTNITANMSISVNHRELLNELRSKGSSTNTKASDSDAVDV